LSDRGWTLHAKKGRRQTRGNGVARRACRPTARAGGLGRESDFAGYDNLPPGYRDYSLGPDHLEARLDVASEMVRLADTMRSRELALRGHAVRARDFLEMADIAAADAEIEWHARLAEEVRDPFDLWLSATCPAMRALLGGRFDEGERLAHAAMTMARRVPGRRAAAENATMCFTAQMYLLRRERGRLEGFVQAIRRLVEHHPEVPAWRAVLAHISCLLGGNGEARGEFDQLATNDFAGLPRDAVWLGAMSVLSELCVLFGDIPHAAILYQLLLPYAGRNCAGLSLCMGSAARYLGLLAATLTRWDAATEHFEAALTMNGRMGARAWVAHTQYDYASALMARGGPGDCERALALVTAARLRRRGPVAKAGWWLVGGAGSPVPLPPLPCTSRPSATTGTSSLRASVARSRSSRATVGRRGRSSGT